MKRLYKSLLILTVILLTGCSFKGSMAKPENNKEEISQLQQNVEELIESNNNLEEKVEDYQNAINEVIDYIESQENNNAEENEDITE